MENDNDKKVPDDVRIEFTRTQQDVDNAYVQGQVNMAVKAVLACAVTLVGQLAWNKYQAKKHPVLAWVRRTVR